MSGTLTFMNTLYMDFEAVTSREIPSTRLALVFTQLYKGSNSLFANYFVGKKPLFQSNSQAHQGKYF